MNLSLRRAVVVAVVLSGAVFAGLHDARKHAEGSAPSTEGEAWREAASPLSPRETRCGVRPAEARLRAITLERAAVSRWQRAPFALAEAPAATRQIAEAEACFRLAGDRGRAAHAATLHRRYRTETQRLFSAAQLRLHASTHRSRAEPRAWTHRSRADLGAPAVEPRRINTEQAASEAREGAARAALATLLALLDGAPSDTNDYRDRLQRLAVRYDDAYGDAP